MMYVDFNADKEYKLRLNTRAIVALEKKLGCNPLSIFGTDGETIPTVTTMVDILHASLQAYHHGITVDGAYDIFDKWLEAGNSSIDFVPLIIELYTVSGIVQDTTEKN